MKLYSAVSKQTVRFRELRESDKSRVRHKRVAEADDKEVPYDEIVKGYEFAPDQYVTLTREELAELDPQKTRAIEIQDFVDLDDIDPIYFEQPYYLGPDKGAAKAYALLVRAMAESRKVAIARFVLRNKEHLAAIRPMTGKNGDVLTMATMRFHDEVTPPEKLDDVFEGTDAAELDKRELEMAERLIDSLATDFDAESYRDQHREQLIELLESKAQGKELVSVPSEEPKPTKAPDLMAALEESLAAVRGEEQKAPSGSNGGTKKSRSKPKSKSKSGSKKKSTAKSSNGAGGKSGSKARSKSSGSKSKSRAKAKS